MSEKENMDELIRDKFSEMDFPFDEENWAKAEEMIALARKKEKTRKWLIVFFCGVCIGMLVLLPFLFTNSDTNKNNNPKDENAPLAIIEKQNDTKVVTEKIVDMSDSTIRNKTNTVVSTDKEIIDSSATIIKNEKNIADVRTKNQTTASVQWNKKNEVKSSKTISFKDRKKDTIDSSKSMVEEVNKNAVVAKNKKKEKRDSSKSTSVVVNKNALAVVNQITTVTTNEKENKSTKTTKNKGEKGDTKETKNNITPTLTTKKTDEVVKPIENVVLNSNTQAILADSIKVAPVKKDTLPVSPVIVKKDSLPMEEVKPIVKPDSTNKPKSTWVFSLEVGVNGFLSGGKGLSPIAGITITKSLNEKWEIGSGAYYTYIPTYTGVSTFTTGANYDFGYTFKLTELVTQKLHYAAVPLFVKYNFNTKNSIIAGANFYYLFNSSNLITTYDISYVGVQNKVTQKANGYYSSFSPYDIGLMAGYRRKINTRFGVALYVNYGLMSLQKTQNVSATNIHNNISGQLLFTYKLFKD